MDRKDTVLFVDDEPYVVEGLQHQLHREGYKILTATSGEEGLKILKETGVDVVVSDEQMPKMRGSEFLAIVCREYPKTIRIILTGQASLDAAIRAINEGEIYRFLTKPCNPSVLAQTIRQGLQFKTLKKESARLLATARGQQKIISDLERDYPGIAKVDRNIEGVIDLEDTDIDVDALINEINSEIASFENSQGSSSEDVV